MVKKFLYLVVICVFAFSSSGYATIAHGTTTSIRISSEPPGATVMVGGQTTITPSSVILKNNQSYHVIFRKDEYEDAFYTIDRHISGWVWGNIIFGGLIGLAIDNMTGGAYKLVPQEVNVKLIPR